MHAYLLIWRSAGARHLRYCRLAGANYFRTNNVAKRLALLGQPNL